MPYSQKYCLVSFIQPVAIGTEFNMADWPLHVTLADVFAINSPQTYIEYELAKLLSGQPSVNAFAMEEAILGTTNVVLLNKTEDLINLHMILVNLLEKNHAVFNSPEFTREGFLPHCAVQIAERILTGDKVNIETIALVDMFPDGIWQQRKVIRNFKLQHAYTD